MYPTSAYISLGARLAIAPTYQKGSPTNPCRPLYSANEIAQVFGLIFATLLIDLPAGGRDERISSRTCGREVLSDGAIGYFDTSTVILGW